MAFVSLKCPNCGGNIQMDDEQEKGFCMYCGSSFLVRDEVQRIHIDHSGSVNLKIDRETEVENLLIRAEQKIEENKAAGKSIDTYYQKIMDEYVEKALDINPNSHAAHELKCRLLEQKHQEIDSVFQKIDEEEKRNNKVLLICFLSVLGLVILIALGSLLT